MFATRVRTQRHSFATARLIAKLKPPLCSAENKLRIGVKIPFSTKYGEWVIYAEPVTYVILLRQFCNQFQCSPPPENFTAFSLQKFNWDKIICEILLITNCKLIY